MIELDKYFKKADLIPAIIQEESTGETIVEPTTPEKTTSAVPFIAIAVVIVAAVIIFIKKKSKAE